MLQLKYPTSPEVAAADPGQRTAIILRSIFVTNVVQELVKPYYTTVTQEPKHLHQFHSLSNFVFLPYGIISRLKALICWKF